MSELTRRDVLKLGGGAAAAAGLGFPAVLRAQAKEVADAGPLVLHRRLLRRRAPSSTAA